MSLRELVRQLNAVKACGPIHRYSTLHFRIDENPMMLAFVRMAGESRPWALAYGRFLDDEPKCLSVPDGRNRNAVAEMCELLAEDLLEYFRVAGYTWDPITKENLGQGETVTYPVEPGQHILTANFPGLGGIGLNEPVATFDVEGKDKKFFTIQMRTGLLVNTLNLLEITRDSYFSTTSQR